MRRGVFWDYEIIQNDEWILEIFFIIDPEGNKYVVAYGTSRKKGNVSLEGYETNI